ncbi:Hint domain-containing protein [uncultured Litoreibacter sp.]|uniref:Hint domain-containing protein n=1 Tax=uncultured Litoreibacter sp. TaxID=1392394 RepID=UPI0026323F53|nr:Hint domain-containing protein [uncultured Litoreibacter sp.]
MPNYDIYILPESEISISGGEQLDGVTQGDGSHLVGETITLNSNMWQAVGITDNNNNFADSQGSNQTLTDAVTLDDPVTGVPETFAAGTNVEAEYALTVTDGTNTYTIIAFNISTGSPAYGTVEALAFIGPVAGFPPIGVPLTVVSNQEGPSNPSEDHASPPCFGKGTMIRTPDGERPVEELRVGDLVETLEHGARPIVWTGTCTYPAAGRFAPIRFDAGVLGNSRALWLSPQHRVQFKGWQADYLFGERAVLVAAHSFVDGRTVRRVEGSFVTYFHVMFDRHEIIFSEGVPTESFFAGDTTLRAMDEDTRAELRLLFPDLEQGADMHARTVLKTLKAPEARVLLDL